MPHFRYGSVFGHSILMVVAFSSFPNFPLMEKVSAKLDSTFFSQWNLRASLSSGGILTCRKAFLISPVMATGLNCPQTNTLHSWFCNSGPLFRHSFRDGASSRPLWRRCTLASTWSFDSSFTHHSLKNIEFPTFNGVWGGLHYSISQLFFNYGIVVTTGRHLL